MYAACRRALGYRTATRCLGHAVTEQRSLYRAVDQLIKRYGSLHLALQCTNSTISVGERTYPKA